MDHVIKRFLLENKHIEVLSENEMTLPNRMNGHRAMIELFIFQPKRWPLARLPNDASERKSPQTDRYLFWTSKESKFFSLFFLDTGLPLIGHRTYGIYVEDKCLEASNLYCR